MSCFIASFLSFLDILLNSSSLFAFCSSSFFFFSSTSFSFWLISFKKASSSVISDFFSSNILISFLGNKLNISFLRSVDLSAINSYCFVPSFLSFINSIDFKFLIFLATLSILFFSSSTVTKILFSSSNFSSKLLGVSTASTFPLFIIITFSHIWLTSDKICELNITVWFFPSFLIKSLISVICFGSSPTVGSSSISTLGSPIRAPAILTLCLYPRDKFLISFFWTSVSPTSCKTLSTFSFLSFLFTYFKSAI